MRDQEKRINSVIETAPTGVETVPAETQAPVQQGYRVFTT